MVFRGIKANIKDTFLGFIGALAGLISGLVLLWFLIALYKPYQGYLGSQQIIAIPLGQTTSQIALNLQTQGIIRSSLLFRWYVRLGYTSSSLKAGEYRFQNAVNLSEVAAKIQQGLVNYYKVAIREDMTIREIVRQLNSEGFGTVKKYQRALQEISLIANLDPLAKNLEGYLFPETYFVTRSMTESEIVATMVKEFRTVWTADRSQRAREIGLTMREVITLASLIEKETSLPEERPLVSAVFQNRLRKNIKLACDPTVIYAVKQIKEYDGIINQSDLALDSPYNTYRYAGLPPGPIANPGLESIDAALHPADVNYLYFVSKNDGSHFFSSNYRNHHKAVQRYQRNGGNR